MNFIMSYSKDDTSLTVSSFRGVISFEMTKNKTLGEMVTQGKFHIKFILGEREKERERERERGKLLYLHLSRSLRIAVT